MDKTNNLVLINFDRDKTQIIKGAAILMMILHHCITPSAGELIHSFGAAMKVCVSTFAFLVGYGYAFSKHKTIMNGLYRAFKLLLQFWLLLFGIFIPLYLIGGGEITFRQLITNMFGITEEYHWFSWFLYYYIVAMCTLPFYSQIIKKWNIKGLMLCIIISFGIECACHTVPDFGKIYVTHILFDSMLYMSVTSLGLYMGINKSFSKIEIKQQYSLFYVLLLLLVIVLLMTKRSITGFLLDIIYVPVMIFVINALLILYPLKSITLVLTKLGDVSMPMWFIHALFVMPFFYTPFLVAIGCDHWFVNTFIATVISYFLAVLFQKVTNPLLSKI